MFHRDILSAVQQELLPLLARFRADFCLCGGTAIALSIGHRESIDFDLFTSGQLDVAAIRKQLILFDPYFSVLVKNEDEYTVLVKRVKMTFLSYPFPFECAAQSDDAVRLPDVLTLGAMKAYALSRRSKWKDYVDLYFILSKHHSLKELSAKSEEMFGNEFNEKVFRAALAYFADIDHSEQVVFRPGSEVDEKTIEKGLVDISTR